MSLHFKFEHEFDIDAKAFWDMFMSEDYNVELYKALKMKERKQLELREEGNKLFRKVHLIPANEIPAIFKKVVSDMSYVEHDVLDRDKSEMTVKIETSLMKDRFHMGGLFSVKPVGEGKCRRTFEGDAKVDIMLLGGKMEKYIVDEMRNSYDVAAKATREYIEKHHKKSA